MRLKRRSLDIIDEPVMPIIEPIRTCIDTSPEEEEAQSESQSVSRASFFKKPDFNETQFRKQYNLDK